MTVAELIEKLRDLPDDMPVRATGEINRVEVMNFYGTRVVYLLGDQE